MVPRILRLIVAALICILWSTTVPAAESITVAGTGDSQELLRRLAAAFMAANPGTVVTVPDSIGSSGGIRATANGDSTLGRVARPIKEQEQRYGLSYAVFARSPVVFAANLPSACTDGLTAEQIVALYRGEIGQWSELEGDCPAEKIYVATRELGDSSRTVIEKEIPAFADQHTLPGQIVYTTPELVATLTGHPHTIGYGPLAMLRHKGLTIFAINGATPDRATVQRGAYPFIVPFGFVWKEPLEGLARRFVTYVYSPAAGEIISAYGAIPMAPPEFLE